MAVAFLAAAGAHAGLAYGDFDFLFDSYIILYFEITALSIRSILAASNQSIIPRAIMTALHY